MATTDKCEIYQGQLLNNKIMIVEFIDYQSGFKS
jgi:hypothetical protein